MVPLNGSCCQNNSNGINGLCWRMNMYGHGQQCEYEKKIFKDINQYIYIATYVLESDIYPTVPEIGSYILCEILPI